ncbi:DUF6056 family protein [Streptomyces sp. NPDC001985]|uniref:DUF6056 family protein n=1 Tax=Streptomyces sp. NPDC001985 TaxID=3154406 RepID=UPI00331972D6
MTEGSSGTVLSPPPGERPRPARAAGATGTRPRGTPAACRPLLLALLPLALLATALWYGQHVRPGADDWCFLPAARESGVTGMVEKFWSKDNGRIVNAVLVGAYAVHDVAGHRWFAPVSGVLVLAVLWSVTSLALRRAGLRTPRGVPLLVASTVAAVFLLASPNTYKTFYWPASAVSHTLAPVLACAAVLPLLLARTRSGRRAALAAVFLAGALLATLSEAAAVVGFVVLGTVLPLGRRLVTGVRRGYARAWCLAGLAGTATGTVVLLASPGSRNRRERYGANASMFAPESLTGALDAFGQILATLLTTWQYLGAVAAGVVLGLVCRGGGAGPSVVLVHRRTLAAAGAAAFLVSGYLCTVIAYPVFGAGTATVSRAWNDYLLLYVVLLVGAGTLLGRAVRARARSARTPRAVGAAGVAAGAVCCLGLAVPLGQLGGEMEARARAWDRQDRWMRVQAAGGAETLPYTPTSVAAMGEPFGKHGSWPAGCVADYYGVERVTHGHRLP